LALEKAHILTTDAVLTEVANIFSVDRLNAYCVAGKAQHVNPVGFHVS